MSGEWCTTWCRSLTPPEGSPCDKRKEVRPCTRAEAEAFQEDLRKNGHRSPKKLQERKDMDSEKKACDYGVATGINVDKSTEPSSRWWCVLEQGHEGVHELMYLCTICGHEHTYHPSTCVLRRFPAVEMMAANVHADLGKLAGSVQEKFDKLQAKAKEHFERFTEVDSILTNYAAKIGSVERVAMQMAKNGSESNALVLERMAKRIEELSVRAQQASQFEVELKALRAGPSGATDRRVHELEQKLMTERNQHDAEVRKLKEQLEELRADLNAKTRRVEELEEQELQEPDDYEDDDEVLDADTIRDIVRQELRSARKRSRS